MERRAQAYTIHRRPTSRPKRGVYYAQFRDPETGERQTAVSTSCSRRDDAVRWCERHLTEAQERRKNITLAAYATGFWRQEGPFATRRTAHGYSCSHGYLEIAEGNTRNHLLPVWGETPLKDLTPGKLDAWIVRLRQEGRLAPATINKLLQTLRTILSQAVADSWIRENPAAFVKPVKAEFVERGILTPEEVTRLLGSPEPWDDFRHYAINLLACTTGARMGEVRGLCMAYVKPDHVEIRASWEEGHGLKPPKNNRVRNVPISPLVSRALERVVCETRPENLVFYGDSRDRPMSKSSIEKNLYRALTRIGIPEVERLQRGITFHSHRHFLNTLLRLRGVHDSKVRAITGHRSEEMSDRYTHYRAADFEEIIELQALLLEA